jgi:Mg2+-importing ATPase
MEENLIHFATSESSKILRELGSSVKGLSTQEASGRLARLGCNSLEEKKKLNLFLEFLSHFKNPLIIILLIASVVSAVFHAAIDATIIAIMLLLSVCLDFFLEHNAERAAERLKEQVKSTADVLRDNQKSRVGIEDLCVGDIIMLSAGSLVPADARIIDAKKFFVSQSVLTGESFPVEKTAATLRNVNLSLSDMKNIVFFGTNAVSGSALAIVVKTGRDTEFGKIASRLASSDQPTEFHKGMTDFGYLIMKVTIFLVLFIFLFNSLFKHTVLESFVFAIAIAVGLTPELLPMIMSVTMARGSLKMAEKGVIVKKLSCIPNFGSMDVLCTDKTGTLTEDKIRLVKYTDVFGKDSVKVLHYAYLNSYYETGVKNALDQAVLDFGAEDVNGYGKIDEIPFDFQRRKMSVIVEKSGKRLLVTKGAPEEVFRSCKYYSLHGKRVPINTTVLKKIHEQYYNFSKQGYRILAIAISSLQGKRRSYSKSDESELELCGFVAFLDPPKQDVREVLQELEDAGIEIKIITGDNELVTKKICDEIGLKVKGVLLERDLNVMSEETLKVRVNNTTIFARFSPDNKNKVIRALRANGRVVGYLGDGINDAPSLKTADIGISVNSAVDVAKESASIVLTRKSLRELKEGVLEGRKTFSNTMKYIMMSLSSNFGNMFSVAIAILFLPFLPMLPVQILLNNFFYDCAQITIPSDRVDPDLIQKPKRWDMTFIKRFMIIFGPVSSIFDLLTFGILFFVFHTDAAAFQTGWFIESVATQTLVIHVVRTKKIPFFQSTASPQLLISSFAFVVLAWLLPYTPIGEFFKFQILPANILLTIICLVILYLITVEIVKRRFYARQEV